MREVDPFEKDPYYADNHATTVFPPMFGALRNLAKKRKIWVAVQMWFGGNEPRGEFVTKDRRPRIMIRVKGGPSKVQDALCSILLAHELGHHQAHVNGEVPAELAEFVRTSIDRLRAEGPALPRTLREQIVADEVRAWNYAREDLRRVGFRRWHSFERNARAAILTYVRALFPDFVP